MGSRRNGLHALKKRGSELGIRIRAASDPLSYLLLACDEIQVWERERPDASGMTSPFKGIELVDFSVSESKIVAEASYALYENVDLNGKLYRETRDKVNNDIVQDNIVLNRFLDGCGLSVRVNRGIPHANYRFSSLCF